MTAGLLIECALKSSILLALAWGVAFALKRGSAATRHVLWTAALAAALALPVLVVLAPPLTPASAPGFLFSATAASAVGGPATDLPLTSIWLIGAALTTAFFLAGHWRTTLIAWRAREVDGLRTTPRAISPFLWGVGNPVVIWPEQAREWPGAMRNAVMAHELEHARRLDAVWLVLGQAACALYWFLPPVWFAAQKAREESERACDDAVLRAGCGATDYAGHLLHVARVASISASLPAVTGASPLERRMRAILDRTMARGTVSRGCVAAIGLACLVVAMPLAALQQEGKIYSLKEDKSVTPPKVLHKVEPAYTETARDAKISGTAVMSVIVEKDGAASNMKIVRSLDPGLDANAIAAVRQWKFQPATKDGAPVRVSATIEIHFRLQ